MYDVVMNLGPLIAAQPKPMLLADASQSAPSHLTETAGAPLWPVDSSQSVAKVVLDTGDKRLSLGEPTVANQWPLSFTKSSHSTPNRLLEDRQKLSLSDDFSHPVSQDGSLDLPSLGAQRSSEMALEEHVTTWYNGYLGTVTIQKRSKHTASSLEVRTIDGQAMFTETAIFLRPSFLNNYYKIGLRESFGGISRTLNVDRVVKNGDPVFQMCRSGDRIGLEGAFRRGRASPDMVNECGMGLLHVSAFSAFLFSLQMLIDISTPQVVTN